jgi:hypothetical protein
MGSGVGVLVVIGTLVVKVRVVAVCVDVTRTISHCDALVLAIIFL